MKPITAIINRCFHYSFVRLLVGGIIGGTILAFLVPIVFFSTGVQTAPVGWERQFSVSPPGIPARNVRMSSKGNLIAMTYESRIKETSTVYVSLSLDGGANYLKPFRIVDIESEGDTNPYVAVSVSGHIAVVWQNMGKDDSITRLFYVVSTDMGATWSSPRQVFNNPEKAPENEILPQFYYDDRGMLHLFYHTFSDAGLTLFHCISANESIFDRVSVLVKLSGGLRGAFFPSILFQGRNAFVVWQGKGAEYSDDLFLISSSNYGESWGSRERLTKSPGSDISPSITLYKGVLYLVYQNNDSKSWGIYLLRGGNNGTIWDEPPIKISTTNANCYSPSIAATAENELIITWYDTRERNAGVYASKYSINQRKAGQEVRLSSGSGAARKPLSLAIGKRVIVFWEEGARIISKFSDISVDPPVVFSSTHPAGAWSKSSSAIVEWRPPVDESGIVGYAAIQNKIMDFNPGIKNLEPGIKKIKTAELDDGITYFHIRAIDGAGNFSRTIHYRLQVSKNPPPTPVVTSDTHPEGRASNNRSPHFTWMVDDTERIKGFLYCFSSDPLKKPDQFSTEFTRRFDSVKDGRYFFKIRSVDKTNTFSRITTYETIVFKADLIDPTTYGRIAKDDAAPAKSLVQVQYTPPVPSVKFNLSFDANQPYTRQNLEALIVPVNIPAGTIDGYSLYIDTARQELPDRVNHRNSIVRVRGLKNGAYVLGVKARYYRMENYRKVYRWTAPVLVHFSVDLSSQDSPMMATMNRYSNRLEHNFFTVAFSCLTVLGSIIGLGFGAKVSFYARLLLFKLSALLGKP